MTSSAEGYISVEKEKILPLVISSDDNYAPYVEVLLYSIMKHLHKEWRCEAYLLTRGINSETENRLQAFCATLPRFQLKVINIPSSCLEGRHLPVRGIWTEATYYRLLIPELLRQYTRMLYMDVDMVAEGDLSPLMQVDMGDNYLAAVPDRGANANSPFKNGYAVETLGIPAQTPYINGGLLVMNIPLLIKENVEAKAFDALLRIGKPLLVDQDIINSCCHDRTLVLDGKWNTFAAHHVFPHYDDDFKKPPVVLHFSIPKPWDVPLYPLGGKWWKYRREATRHYELSLAGKAQENASPSVRFSFILPLHNAGQNALSCISSILRQTFANFELLVCDDLSEDNTLDLLQKLEKQDGRVRVFHQHIHWGNAITQNMLAWLLEGEYAILMDVNDILTPDFLEKASAALDERDCDILGMPYEIATPDGISAVMQQPEMAVAGPSLLPLYLNSENPVGETLVKNDDQHPWTLCAKVIKTRVLRQSLPPTTVLLRDRQYLMFSLFHHCTVYRWKAFGSPVWRRNVPTDVLHQLGREMSLDTFRLFCEALSGELQYKLSYLNAHHLDNGFVVPTVNVSGLESLLRSLAAFEPAQQTAALRIFFEYFCRDENLLPQCPYSIGTEGVMARLQQVLPLISQTLVEQCRQGAQAAGGQTSAIPEEYLQAYATVQKMNGNATQFLYDQFNLLPHWDIHCQFAESFKRYLLEPKFKKLFQHYPDSESQEAARSGLARLLSMPQPGQVGLYLESATQSQQEAADWKEYQQEIPAYRQKYHDCFDYYDPTVFFYKHGMRFLQEPQVWEKIRDGVALDCGAFDGASMMLMNEYAPQKLYGFEPSQKNLKVCEANLKKAMLTTDWNLVGSCVGAKDGEVDFEDSGTSGAHTSDDGNSASTGKVPIMRLDSFVKQNDIPKVSWIKADLEGAAYDMVLGAEAIIKRDKPLLTLAVYHNAKEFFEVPALLHQWVPEYKMMLRRCECNPKAEYNELTLIAYISREAPQQERGNFKTSASR